MNPINPLDDEIRAVELRIARGRNALAALGGDWTGALRDALVSTRSLVGVAALGFALGEVMRPARNVAPGNKRRFGGLLLGIAATLFRARYGSPWEIAAGALTGRRRNDY